MSRWLAGAVTGAGMAIAALTAAAPGAETSPPGAVLDLDTGEVRRILQHGPWPPSPPRDPSNRVSGEAWAIELGRRLFFDARLSANGAVACATCHVPEHAWTDGRPRAAALGALDRNTPTVLNAGLLRWFSWDGRADSLWSQSVQPILDAREMGGSAAHVATVVRGDGELRCLYGRAFAEPEGGDERVLVNVAKALAAFVETLLSGRTNFDEFRDALARGDGVAAGRYPAGARRGLRIFVGKGNCSVCHLGPQFTNNEFHDVGVPYLVAPGRVDSGRHDGIKRLRADRFNLLGAHSDDATGGAATKTRHVELQHANFGQFKTPSLRSVARTPPYMHDGRLATLRDVVRHYSELNPERIHSHGEQLLRPLALSEGEIDDLVAFLESLSDAPSLAAPALAPARPCGDRW